MLSQIKIYKNGLGWEYRNVGGVVLVFDKDKLVKIISVSELNEKIKLRLVK